jgi:hypothetical protein
MKTMDSTNHEILRFWFGDSADDTAVIQQRFSSWGGAVNDRLDRRALRAIATS